MANLNVFFLSKFYMNAVEINLMPPPELWETMFDQLNLADDAQARLQARTKFGSGTFDLLCRTLYKLNLAQVHLIFCVARCTKPSMLRDTPR